MTIPGPEPHWQIAAVIGLALGLLIGALITGWAGARRTARLRTEIAVARTRLEDRASLDEERAIALELAEERLAAAFSGLSDRSLRANSDAFLRLAQEHLGQHQTRARAELEAREKAVQALVGPIFEALEKTRGEIASIENQRKEAYGGIHSELQAMHFAQEGLRVETRRLVTALRRPEVRGRWGELTLQRLVELAGMVKHCDFELQAHRNAEDGAIRPDLIVRMPDERELVVDAKTPLDAYLGALEADDPEVRARELKRHAGNVRDHVRTLAGKTYWSQFARAPEFVILFVPGEQFLSAALEEDRGLLEDAIRQRVILATPTSFIALLKAVAYGWRQVTLAGHAEEIRDLAQTLHKRLGTFASHLAALGRHLDSAVAAFNRGVGSLERQVLPAARRFSELGVEERRPIENLEPVERRARVPNDAEPSGQDPANRNQSEE